MNQKLGLFLVIIILSLTGCSQEQSPTLAQQAVVIESGDECHLCGMLITQFSGPKGEIFNKKATKAHKFCSTRDLFSYYLQPENKRQVQQILVHDMAQTPWDKPNDEHFINAKTAWYVKEHNQQGAMGATLAAFSTEHDAKLFIKNYGGKTLRFNDITFELLANI